MERKIQKPYDLTYIKALEAAKMCKFNIKKESLTDGLITYKVSMSLFSWGETFFIQLSKINATSTLVTVKSQNNQLGSWGKHEQNVNDFFSMLNNLLSK